MQIKLFDSELKVMEILWEKDSATAKEIASVLGERIGWSKTTTYTVIKKCVDKGAIERSGKDFLCTPMITKEEVQQSETAELIAKMYNGAADRLVAAILHNKNLSEEEIDKLKRIIKDLE